MGDRLNFSVVREPERADPDAICVTLFEEDGQAMGWFIGPMVSSSRGPSLTYLPKLARRKVATALCADEHGDGRAPRRVRRRPARPPGDGMTSAKDDMDGAVWWSGSFEVAPSDDVHVYYLAVETHRGGFRWAVRRFCAGVAVRTGTETFAREADARKAGRPAMIATCAVTRLGRSR